MNCEVPDPLLIPKASALAISDPLCSSQIIETLEEVSVVLSQNGISRPFVDALKTVQLAAGDIDEADGFRSELISTLAAFDQAVQYQEIGNVSFDGVSYRGGSGIRTRNGQVDSSSTRSEWNALWILALGSVFLF